jgi:hypothetical protein
MSVHQRPGPGASAGEVPRPSKRPYVKPTLQSEKLFETTALICGKVQHTQRGCHQQRKS